jgi:hypothetical protein
MGNLRSGEDVYYRQDERALAVLKDHKYLAAPVPEEMKEILETMPHLKPIKEVKL